MIMGGTTVAITALYSAARNVIIIPEQISRHEAELRVLHEMESKTAKELQSQREILIEIRTDLGYVKRAQGIHPYDFRQALPTSSAMPTETQTKTKEQK